MNRIDLPRSAPAPWASTLHLVAPLAAYRIGLLLLVKFNLMLMPMQFVRSSNDRVDVHSVSFAQACFTWDALNYLQISTSGYVGRPDLTIYLPLWPACMYLTFLITGGALIGAVILANVISLASLLVLHRYAALRLGEAAANASILILLASPGAFFFGLPYTESLFLLLVATLFLSLETDCFWLAWASSFLALFTRPVGFFCILPIVVDQVSKGKTQRAFWLASGPLLGLFGYLLLMKTLSGESLGLASHQSPTYGAAAVRLLHPLRFLQNFFTPNIEIHGYHNSAIDRGLVLLCIASLFWVARRSLAELAFAIPLIIVPAVSNDMMSFTRYAVVVIPVYLTFGQLLSKPARRPWLILICTFLFGVQMLLMIRQTHGYWVG